MFSVHSSYTPGRISTTRIRREGRLHLVTVTRMVSGVCTVNPSKATALAVLPVTVLVKKVCPALRTSTVKSSATPSSGSDGK